MAEDTAPAPQETETSMDEGNAPEGATEATEQPEPEQAAKDDSSDDFNVEVSLDDVPSTLRPAVEKHVRALEKQFKGAYTKKTQSLAEKSKSWETEKEKLVGTLTGFQQIAQEVLRDPEKLSQYRKQYGYESATPAPEAERIDPSKLETVGDLVDYVEKRLDSIASQTTQTAENRAEARLAAGRWDQALDSMRSDPKFTAWEQVIVSHAMTQPKYKQLYHSGAKEKQVLETAFNDIKDLLRNDLEAVKQKTLQTVKTRGRQTTEQPTNTKTDTVASDRKLTKDQIINKIREQYGPGMTRS